MASRVPPTAGKSRGSSQNRVRPGKIKGQGQQRAATQTQVFLTWSQCVRKWYPGLLQRAYFLPHVHMNRVLRLTTDIAGMKVAVPQPPVNTQEASPTARALWKSDVQDDTAQQLALNCVKRVAESRGDVMFVLSQMNFSDYLSKPCYAAACRNLLKPADLKNMKLDRGDFDILIIHREYGLLACEIKSVGVNSVARAHTDDPVRREVLERLRKMLRTDQTKLGQLQKAKTVLMYVLSDLAVPPRVQMTLVLPYITTDQLRLALEKDAVVKEALRTDLGLSEGDDPAHACLCSDKMADDATLCQWWDQILSRNGRDGAMSDAVYEEIVMRFAGPASVIRIHCPTEPRLRVTPLRSVGEYVRETGDRLTTIALYPQQVALINAAEDLVYLVGPPGTGKTLMLVVSALEWLRDPLDLHIHILVSSAKAVAASHYIQQQLQVTAREIIGEDAAGRVHVTEADLADKSGAELDSVVEKAVDILAMTARDGQICLIVDEASNMKSGLEALYAGLTAHPNIRRVRLWAASYEPDDRPECLALHQFTEPLRCPPAVVREVQQAPHIQTNKTIPDYTPPLAPAPTDGPEVIKVYHHGAGHEEKYTEECVACGVRVGRVLRDQLRVSAGCPADCKTTRKVVGLEYKDVFVLAAGDRLHDGDNGDVSSHATKPTSGLVRGLREAGVPVRVVKRNDRTGLADVAKMATNDGVIATSYCNVRGLERKVVVWLAGPSWKDFEATGRLDAMSRCSAQLILVVDYEVPQDDSSDDSPEQEAVVPDVP